MSTDQLTADAESVVNDEGNICLVSDLDGGPVRQDKGKQILKGQTLAISARFGTLYFGLPMDSR